MIIYLIRHGETTGDIEGRYGGSYDDHLSKKGLLQAKELGKKLLEKHIDVIFHSSKIRATETAQIVSKQLKVSLKSKDDLRERNQYGVLSGLVKSEAKNMYPKEVEKLSIHPYKNFIMDSESYDSFVVRVKKIFTNIIQEKSNTIAIITHGGVIKALFREEFQLGEFKTLGDCAIIKLKLIEGKVILLSLDGAELV